MPFKIVETTENGRRLLSTVPAQWEYHGTLYRPRKNETILESSEYSVPENNWKTMPCLLKRNNISNYEASEREIGLMLNMSDTDQEVLVENSLYEVEKSTSTEIRKSFNDLVAECLPDKAQESGETLSTSEIVLPKTMSIHEPTDQIIELIDTNTQQVQPYAEKIDVLISMATANEANIQILFDNQQSTIQKLALLDAKLEEFINRTSAPVADMNPRANIREFKIVGNLEELNSLENQLSSPQVEENFIRILSVTCIKGKGRAYNNAYALIDAMFTRQFLTECSWAGGTRGYPKTCFNSFTKTLALFFKVTHQYDNNFTKPECENFMKNIMRHSIKRNASKLLRASTQKRRPKRNVLHEVNHHAVRNHPNIPTESEAKEEEEENIPHRTS